MVNDIKYARELVWYTWMSCAGTHAEKMRGNAPVEGLVNPEKCFVGNIL